MSQTVQFQIQFSISTQFKALFKYSSIVKNISIPSYSV